MMTPLTILISLLAVLSCRKTMGATGGDDGEAVDSANATAPEIGRLKLLGPPPRSDSATQNYNDKAKKHAATTTLRDPITRRTDQNNVVIPFLSVPLLEQINDTGWPDTDHVRQYQL
jgi:hypothetical protein